MYPFAGPVRWHLRNRQQHLIAVAEEHIDTLRDPYREVVEARMGSLRRWLVVRIVLFGLLYFSLAATIVGVIVAQWPWADLFEDTVARVNRILRTLTGIITVAALVVWRYLGQLEADLIGCLAVGRGAAPRKKARARKR